MLPYNQQGWDKGWWDNQRIHRWKQWPSPKLQDWKGSAWTLKNYAQKSLNEYWNYSLWIPHFCCTMICVKICSAYLIKAPLSLGQNSHGSMSQVQVGTEFLSGNMIGFGLGFNLSYIIVGVYSKQEGFLIIVTSIWSLNTAATTSPATHISNLELGNLIIEVTEARKHYCSLSTPVVVPQAEFAYPNPQRESHAFIHPTDPTISLW